MRLLGAAQVRSLLRENQLAPRKAAGQNFVVDPNTVRKVVRDGGVTAGDLVCEIGPGLGSLTLALREAGAFVVAVEIDAGLVRVLTGLVGDDPGVRLHHADALEVDFPALLGRAREVWGTGREAVLVANLPYNVATPLLMRALESGAVSRALVMVQREVGERWVARPGQPLYSGVSVKIAALADAHIAAMVSRKAFYPEPRVDSVTVRLAVRPAIQGAARDALFRLVERGFQQRRKRLRNSLASAATPAVAVEQALERAGLDRGSRPEELDLQAWQRLAAALAG